MKFLKPLIKGAVTLSLLAIASYFGYEKYQEYFNNPWTRDGQVRAQVIQVSPRVSGEVIKIMVQDNQFVKQGDLLFEIDPEPFRIQLAQSQADLRREKVNLRGTKVEFERVKKIAKRDKGAVSQKDLIRHEVNYLKSLAQIDALEQKINTAKLNLEFCKVHASVDGYVSNINFQTGSQAVANNPILALVDVNSFWVFGYFRENMISEVKVGNASKVTLMAYPDTPLSGHVESIGWGISHSDGNPGPNLLPSIQPVFQWIRLAQRIPVRVKLDTLPEGIELRVGLSASVMVMKED